MIKVLLIDALNLIRRIHSAIPPDGNGEQIQVDKAIQSSTQSIRRALNQHHPTHCVVVFEDGGKNWRHHLLPTYKQNRPPMPTSLAEALPIFKTSFLKIGIKSFSCSGFEADDVIATLATKISTTDGKTVILSTDKLQAQSLNDNIQLYDHFNQQFIDQEVISKKFDVHPNQLVDLFSLAGDSGHSIPGIQSIGIRTAAKLLNSYDNLDNIFDHLSDITGALGTKLLNGVEDAKLARQLFRLRTDIHLGINLHDFRYNSTATASI